MTTLTMDDLQQENEALRRRLEEAEEALHALRAGEVDAILVGTENEQVFTLETADTPYRLVVEQMSHAAATLTLDGTILYCNRNFADLLKRSVRALQGQALAIFAAPDSVPSLDALLRDGQAAEAQSEITLLRADGTAVRAYLSVRAVREGALGECLLITDLSEQRQYKELQRSQEIIAADLADMKLLQEMSTRIIHEDDINLLYQNILEAAGAIMRSSLGSLRALDADRGELVVLASRGFDKETADAFKLVSTFSGSTYGETLRTGQRSIAADVETCNFIVGTAGLAAYRRSGVRASQTTPLYSRGGRLLGMLSTHWREPHHPDERDLRLLDVLARQAADLMERAQTETALRDADRKKDEFLATLAHELRNPLAPITNALHVMQLRPCDDPQLLWARDLIQRQTQQLVRLVDDLLDVSRITTGKVRLRTEPVSLASIIQRALESSQPLIDASRHQLTVSLAPEPMRLDADPARLAQVFANLLNNAAKYTEPGGHISLTARRFGDQVEVRVKDAGIGIPGELLPKIFDLFTQADRSLERSKGGLGIGLSLVKSLVRMHGGTVTAQSDGVGKGSEFIVRLPLLATAAPQDAPGIRLPMADGGHSLRILVVDDNVDAAHSLATLLRSQGHEAVAANDGHAALDAVQARPFDMVLLDIGLPGMSGYEVCARLRQQDDTGKTVVVALTGYGRDDDKRRSQDAGFDAHLVKPVMQEQLQALCARIAPAKGCLPRPPQHG